LEGFILLHYYFILRLKLHTKEKIKIKTKEKKRKNILKKKPNKHLNFNPENKCENLEERNQVILPTFSSQGTLQQNLDILRS
jgi:hypothetical protein